ncbi:MAG TPA: hypothetical protein VK638_10255 [Edaphobacter sp.]|nr:hypothetical protein [Edaphobacter sp.]
MSSITISSIVFACVFGGALFGMSLRAMLPESHVDTSSRDVVRLSMGLVVTMAALVLGLLVASAKGSYDAQIAQASSMVLSLGETRWLMSSQNANSISKPMLVILVFWLTIIFISFGLYAPANATVISALFVCALSVSGAILLIQDLYAPYSGVMTISSAPLRNALAMLGQ